MTEHKDAARAVVILGGASSVARALAAEFARDGHALVLADYDHEQTEHVAADLRVRYGTEVHTLPFDATAYDTHEAFAGACSKKLGAPPEGLAVCFGFMADQAESQADFALTQRTFDTNLTGTVSIVECFAAQFEARGSGFIAVISSVAGDRGRQSNYIYGASKAGMTAYLQGLRNRLYKAGVHVLTVKPGFMDTKMTYGLPLPAPLVATPEQAARAIYRALKRRKNVVYVRFFWRYIMMIICGIPEWQFKKMDI